MEYGDVTYMLTDKESLPDSPEGTADVDRVQVSLALWPLQYYTKVQDLFGSI